MTRAAEIASFLEVGLAGPDMEVTELRSAADARAGAMVFLSRRDPELVAQINAAGAVLCLATDAIAEDLRCSVLVHDSPRLAFCRVAQAFFVPPVAAGRHASAVVAPSADLHADVSIGPGCVIGEAVRIGAGTVLGANVVVADHVSIGAHCVLKSNSTIGESGFGFARDPAQIPVPFPHLGTVSIGDHVEIGANCTVVRAALDVTRIDDHVKTDDHVHIAHNAHIGARTYIAAGVVVSGSATVGSEVWIGPNATISDYVSIGDRAHIALGAVVRKSVPAGCTMFGNPARVIKREKRGA